LEIIRLEDVSFSYDGKKNVVDHVSFALESGKYIAIIGHNGSGKSTLAKLLLGLLEAGSGNIVLFGRELKEENVREIRQRIGIVFQNPDNQFIGATVRDDIAFGLENRRVPHQEMDGIINEFAQKVKMEAFLDKEPANLSGGQKQRVAIAGVLAMHPDIVIFDEATAMLDPRGKREIREIALSMRQENPSLTILSITHDIEEAFQSDEIMVMNEGQIVMRGTPQEVFARKEELLAIDLDLPFAYKMKDALLKEGFAVKDLNSMEDLVTFLCQ
jgi:energy-coupling factor transport system ATP-binding protein